MTVRPRILDLFCGAGGCAAGYHRAGFDVVGVDIAPQPRYPFDFVQGDAMQYLADHGREFDALHASPPCQAYSRLTGMWEGARASHAELVDHVRALFLGYPVPWVIENVFGSPLKTAIMLCGSMFGLKVRRHRLFECSDVLLTMQCQHRKQGRAVQVNGHSGGSSLRDAHSPRHSVSEWKDAMGIDWMTGKELTQAIPPVYTEFIGKQLLALLPN